AKFLATSLTLGSGGSGGIFMPCLFCGVMVGSFFGQMALEQPGMLDRRWWEDHIMAWAMR
ncbi:MAG: chloride channel protein, partial [SAR324 cluster bacterium]|nr:chloride channel protein [SAR324 cluster bacterium]